DDDGDQGEEIAAPARVWLLASRRRLAHAVGLHGGWSGPPSAAAALATIPFASSPAAAYMRSGLAWSRNLSGSVIVRTLSPLSSAPASASRVSTCAPKPPA